MTTTTAAEQDSATDGADAEADAASDDGDVEVVIEPTGRARNRAGVLSGIVVFGYVLFLAVEVVVADVDHRAYNRLHELQGNVVARVVVGVVIICALFHALNGLRLLVADLPAMARHNAALRSLVAFATFALGIPAAAVVLWPSVSEVLR